VLQFLPGPTAGCKESDQTIIAFFGFAVGRGMDKAQLMATAPERDGQRGCYLSEAGLPFGR
jgi:hypothetical protein